MSAELGSILSRMNHDHKVNKDINYKKELITIQDLIQKEQYIGEVFNLAYSEAKVHINDAFRKIVGGIPAQCFLIASRINNENINYDDEDSSVILLRVVESTTLLGDHEKDRIILDNIERNHNSEKYWDNEIQDPTTKNLLSFGAVKCRVVGTFYMEKEKGEYQLKFGNDLSNFYPSKTLKVYKPSNKALEAIVNFGISDALSVKVGAVRYSSTNRKSQGVSEVSVKINPKDLIAQKTAVFGMTRTGKSNTVKIIAKSIYQLRQKASQKIGQLIFDVNGEYANDNMQDINAEGIPQSLKNVWQIPVNGEQGSIDDVVIYGLMKNTKDPKRIIMKINFYDDELLQIGKELIDDQLMFDKSNNAQYVKNFINTSFDTLEDLSEGEKTRELRRRLIYKTILYKAGFKSEGVLTSGTNKSLFSQDLIAQLNAGIQDYDDLSEVKQKELKSNLQNYKYVAQVLEKFNTNGASFEEMAEAFKYFAEYIKDNNSTYQEFERIYLQKNKSSVWLDVNTSSLLDMYGYGNAFKKIAKATIYHDKSSGKKDYVQSIYENLTKGKLVIIDQSLGDSALNKLAAERILKKIFEENSKEFSEAKTPYGILIYIEEAHNLMPKGSEEDTTNIWARVAKEGAKFNIGMIYSTQEVSSIQKNILKNTTNWFISHLNNKEEIKALSDYYDFEDFSLSILQAEDKGFIRMKTKSNKFVVPIQVDKFEIEG